MAFFQDSIKQNSFLNHLFGLAILFSQLVLKQRIFWAHEFLEKEVHTKGIKVFEGLNRPLVNFLVHGKLRDQDQSSA